MIEKDLAEDKAEKYVRMKMSELLSTGKGEEAYPALFRKAQSSPFARKRAERSIARALIHVMPIIYTTELLVVAPEVVMIALEYGFYITNEYISQIEEGV